MSYDVNLKCDHCESWVFEVNYTSNCSGMWYDAGIDIREFDGKKASECVEALEGAIAKIRADPAKYTAMQPENGWGSYEGVLSRFLEPLAMAMRTHPHAVIGVWA